MYFSNGSGSMSSTGGSYSSLYARPTGAIDIKSSNRAHDDSCAFPSWPRRDSLSDSDCSTTRPTSFLSDDELNFSLDSEDPFFDDSDASVSSRQSLEHQLELEMQRERERLQQREVYLKQMVAEKERERRRKQQALRQAQFTQQPRKGGSPRKHTRSKLSA